MPQTLSFFTQKLDRLDQCILTPLPQNSVVHPNRFLSALEKRGRTRTPDLNLNTHPGISLEIQKMPDYPRFAPSTIVFRFKKIFTGIARSCRTGSDSLGIFCLIFWSLFQ